MLVLCSGGSPIKTKKLAKKQNFLHSPLLLGIRQVVRLRTLNPASGVRIPHSQPKYYQIKNLVIMTRFFIFLIHSKDHPNQVDSSPSLPFHHWIPSMNHVVDHSKAPHQYYLDREDRAPQRHHDHSRHRENNLHR